MWHQEALVYQPERLRGELRSSELLRSVIGAVLVMFNYINFGKVGSLVADVCMNVAGCVCVPLVHVLFRCLCLCLFGVRFYCDLCILWVCALCVLLRL